ncbi:NUDIX domain-containing protein [uncultured Methanobrevibacter sp.]|uniref:NUDIX domain-containing protein n=1 Tax=uncultured Methanobrevibacter sp. TaxID=253161 RepID=UPI0025FE7EA9|nr:NUDIX domain-containing protein [uncultured Methanobrevibacter sp.]
MNEEKIGFGLSIRLISIKKDKLLLLQRPNKRFHDSGKWEFPGGKVKKDEFFDEGLKREVFEETNLNVKIVGFYSACEDTFKSCKNHQNIKSINLAMYGILDEGEIQLSNEHTDYSYFSKEEIKKLDAKGKLTLITSKLLKSNNFNF